MARQTLTITADVEHLREQLAHLGELRISLLTGATFDSAARWPDALRVVIDTLATEHPRLVARACRCGGPLQRTTAIVAGADQRVTACTECEFLEITR